jgi:hypothetical protein
LPGPPRGGRSAARGLVRAARRAPAVAAAACRLAVAGALATAAAPRGPLGAQAAPGALPTANGHRTARPAESARSRGPLRIAERNPLYHLFLTPMVLGADVLAAGERWIGIGSAYSNVFERNQGETLQQLFDLERLHSTVTVRQGVRDGLELGVQVGVQHSWGGFLDPLIQGVHTTFGFPNAGREQVSDNAFGLRLAGVGDAAPVYLDLPSGFAVDAPRLFGAWRLAGGREADRALTARATWKLPWGDARATTGRSDVAVELAARRSWGRRHLHLAAGAVRLDAPARLRPLMRPAAVLGTIGIEHTHSERLALLAQFTGSTAYTRATDFSDLTRPAVNFALGAQGRLGGWQWQVSFAEDLPANSPAVDFTLDVQLARAR